MSVSVYLYETVQIILEFISIFILQNVIIIIIIITAHSWRWKGNHVIAHLWV